MKKNLTNVQLALEGQLKSLMSKRSKVKMLDVCLVSQNTRAAVRCKLKSCPVQRGVRGEMVIVLTDVCVCVCVR